MPPETLPIRLPIRLPPGAPDPNLDADAILGAFLEWAAQSGFQLYPAQEEAVFALLSEQHVVLSTPTGSGKSLVAAALMLRALATGQTAYYTCPVKALVNEKFFDLCRLFGARNVGLATGDATVNPGAPLQCATAEILSNRSLRNATPPAFVVMDEFHYYADRERGIAWQIPLITLSGTQFLLMSATLGDLDPIIRALKTATGRDTVHVRGMQRPVPLAFEYRETALFHTVSELVQSNRAPIYLVNFTQRACVEEAQNLTSIDLCSREEKAAITQVIRGERFSSPYGKEFQRFLRVGIGLHHAGLLPRYRRLCERLAQAGLLKVVSGTDTLGVGVNIPIRTVLFTQLCKFDGEKDVILPVRDFHQIAGRAGRKGFDDQGYVVAQAPVHVIENKLQEAKGKKFVRKQPPKKGYVHFDRGVFDRLCAGTAEPLESRFSVSHSLVLSALQAEGVDPKRGAGYRRLVELIAHCHDGPGGKRRSLRNAAQYFRTLRHLGLVTLVHDEKARNPYPIVNTELQLDFSLDQTLALYLVETLDLLPQDRTPPEHALDVLSLVEAVLENPRPILLAQLDREKSIAVAEMKAAGVEFAERMEKLDQLEWPKPNRDFIYATFDVFREHHPWVGQDNVAPKAIARELVENNASFSELVRELQVPRSEGVLLRYLTQAWKTLAQGVPARHRTPEIEEMALTLETAVRMVDASLLEEWRVMMGGGVPEVVPEPEAVEKTPRRRSLAQLADNPRALLVRVRAELHRLLEALARKAYDDALECILPEDEGGVAWTVERLGAALAPYFAEHSAIDARPGARAPAFTHLKSVGELKWEAAQTLVDPAGGGIKARGEDSGEVGTEPETPGTGFAIQVVVDLSVASREGLGDEAPVIQLRGVGT